MPRRKNLINMESTARKLEPADLPEKARVRQSAETRGKNAAPDSPATPQKKRNTGLRAQREFRHFARLFLIAALFVSLASVVVAGYAQLAVAGYEYDRARQQLQEIRNQNEEMVAEIAQLSSLQHVEQVAVNDLGMTVPVQYRPIQVALKPVQSGTVADMAARSTRTASVALQPVEREPGTLAIVRQFDWDSMAVANLVTTAGRMIYGWFVTGSAQAAGL